MCSIPVTSGTILDKIMPDDYPNEKADVDHTLLLFQALDGYLFEFSAAVDLFEHVEGIWQQHTRNVWAELTEPLNKSEGWRRLTVSRKLVSWALIPSRDAAISIYHFKKTLDAFNHSIRKCPTLFQKIDPVSLRESGRIFSRSFPKAERLRHAVAHSAEHKVTRESFARHMEKGTYLENRLDGRTFTLSREREELSIEISHKTTAILENVMQSIRNSFAPLL